MSIAIPAPGLGLNLAGTSEYHIIVLYELFTTKDKKAAFGVFGKDEVSLEEGKVRFAITRFGSFQAIKVKSTIAEKIEDNKEIETDVSINDITINYGQISLNTALPFVVKEGETVKLTGTNFHPVMTLAMGNTPIAKVEVISDSVATFVVPTGVIYGLYQVTIAQRGNDPVSFQLFSQAN